MSDNVWCHDCPSEQPPSLQYVGGQPPTSEVDESESDAEGLPAAELAPDIGQDVAVAELDNGGQWSPLPLEPEDYEGEVAIPEEYDSLAIAAAREQVQNTETCTPPMPCKPSGSSISLL